MAPHDDSTPASPASTARPPSRSGQVPRSSFLHALGLPTTSIGRKIALTVALPVSLAVLLGVAVLWRNALQSAEEDSVEEGSALADLVATSFNLATRADPEPHAAVVAALHTDWKLLSSVKGVRVVDPHGAVRWSRQTEEQGQKLLDPSSFLDQPTATHAGGRFVVPVGGASCASCHAGDSMRLGYVVMDLKPPRQLSTIDDSYRFAMGGVVAFSVIFLGLMTFSLRRFVTRPVKRLTQAMDRAKTGDFLVRVPVETDDEVGELAADFNATLARITELKVAEIETGRDLERMQRELALKQELEAANGRLQTRIRELQLLFEVTRSVNSTLELEPLLNLISELVGKALGFAEFSVMLVDGQELVLHSGFGETVLPGEVRFKMGEGAAGEAAEKLTEIYVEDVAKDARFIRRADERGSLLCVPMIVKDELVGVLNFRKREVGAFGPDDVRLLKSVANQSAMAIVNARLYQATVELSITDALTGAFNRRHLFSRLEMELLRAQRFGHPLGVVMIDIDHFKHFNDTNGHPAGDEVLRRASALFKAQLRKLDVLARYGGEEFFVVLPQTSKVEALEAAEKLRRAVERTEFPCGEKQPGGKVTISVGVASFPEDASELEVLIDAVDSALYQSKRGGRNKVTAFAKGMEEHPGRERGKKAAAQARGEQAPAVITATEAMQAAGEPKEDRRTR
ncbi:MAG: diguanylate cyclase [Deltaproteobacteria bacterium]|nr:diguanylate cyclase [Deltaproteobacteria bacterium]